jgi:hypothetical protein
MIKAIAGFLQSVKNPDRDSSWLSNEVGGGLYKIALFQLVTVVLAISTPGIVCALFKM